MLHDGGLMSFTVNLQLNCDPHCQVLDPQYGMYVWPCAVVLAQYLWTQRQELRNKTVLEVRGSTFDLLGKLARPDGGGRCEVSLHSLVQV